MTRSEEKLITFKDLLNLVTGQIKIYLAHPDPEMQGLIHHFPRIISNTVFDNTSSIEFCIQKVHHQEGKFFRKKQIKERIDVLKPYIKELKKYIRTFSYKKWRGAYNDKVSLAKIRLEESEKELKILQEEFSKIGELHFMHEHVTGREQASKYILDYILQENLIMDIEKTKEVLKKFCFTIYLEKSKNVHTKANKKLETIQNGNTTFDDYEKIITELGYQNLSEELRPKFEEAKIDLQYFNK